ncbi:MAG: winged helix-turn-helix transcriptional regulator [Rhodospirillaceae bacterium]|nr:winged helix-turn-helix transcriptional regulator [Rhodospirillaceae bacterium]
MERPAQPKTLVSDARAVVRDCVGLNIRLAARRITRVLDAEMAETGLSLAQFGLMAQIAAATDDTIGALAERAGLDQSTLSRTLRTLERTGLVEITVVEADLRRRAVWLTEAGAHRLEAALPAWHRGQALLAQAIDAATVQRLVAATAALFPAP